MARRAKQEHLPDMAPPVHPDIEEAADHYREVRDNRMQLTKEEITAKAALLAAMNAHELESYRLDNGAVVKVTEKKDVKVNIPKDEDEADDLDEIEHEAA